MKTDNEIIAEFMGDSKIHPRKRAYSYSWDWLMPVIEKIDTIDDGKYIVTIEPLITIISNMGEAPIIEVQFGGRMDNTYKAVVDFIKWYNDSVLIEREKE